MTNEIHLIKEIKRIIEALLFSSSEPLSLSRIKEIIETFYPLNSSEELKAIIQELSTEYQREGRAFQLDLIAEGYALRTVADMHPYVEQLLKQKRPDKLSYAVTEVLAIIAYRGPITRPEIEKLRGVDSSSAVASLIERGLIQAMGKKDSPGRPMQYGVAKKFLQHFGLNNLQELKHS